jgi:hypothetical protein
MKTMEKHKKTGNRKTCETNNKSNQCLLPTNFTQLKKTLPAKPQPIQSTSI